MSLWTLPNSITFLRILLTPVVIALLVQETTTSFGLSLLLFTIAAITDFCDGYVARRMGNFSLVGAYLDPLADKILVLTLCATFVYLQVIPLGIVLVFIARDILLTALRTILAAQGVALQTTMIAKWKTFLQFLLLYGGYSVVAFRLGLLKLPLVYVETSFLFIACGIALLTLYTAVDYAVRYRKIIESLLLNIKIVDRYEPLMLGVATLGFAWISIPAPGTVASIITTMAVYGCMFLLPPRNPWVGLGLGILFLVAWLCSTRAERTLGYEDPGIVVIDEVFAMLLICYFLPVHSLLWYTFACILFRFFDIFKPYPINYVERTIKGGLGIMLDDVVAALYTLFILFIVMAAF